MSRVRRARLVLPVWKILLMHAPFRVFRHGAPGFAPGVRSSLRYIQRVCWHALFDRERAKYWFMRLRRTFK